MSDFSTQDPALNAAETGQQELEQPVSLSPYAQDFVSKLPETERGVGTKWVSEWDKNVQKKFNEYNSRIKPWEELGVDPQTAKQYVALVNALNEDPQTIFERLIEQGIVKPPQAQQTQNEDWTQGLAPEIVEKLKKAEELESKYSKLEKATAGIYQQMSQKEQAALRQQEEQAFEQELSGILKTTNLDRALVLGLVASGQFDSIQEAADHAMKIVGQRAPSAPAPKLVTGGGVPTPSPGTDFAKMDSKDTRSFVASALQQINKG